MYFRILEYLHDYGCGQSVADSCRALQQKPGNKLCMCAWGNNDKDNSCHNTSSARRTSQKQPRSYATELWQWRLFWRCCCCKHLLLQVSVYLATNEIYNYVSCSARTHAQLWVHDCSNCCTLSLEWNVNFTEWKGSSTSCISIELSKPGTHDE